MSVSHLSLPIALLIGALVLAAVSATHHESRSPDLPKAHVELKNGQGQTVGVAELVEGASGLLVTVRLRDISPGIHAVHIHAAGKCDAPAFESAGDHFNPTDRAHGLLASAGPHLGDLSNVHVPAAGRVEADLYANGLRLRGANGVLDGDGAALVVHAAGDDYLTDPSGGAGDRIACGLIR